MSKLLIFLVIAVVLNKIFNFMKEKQQHSGMKHTNFVNDVEHTFHKKLSEIGNNPAEQQQAIIKSCALGNEIIAKETHNIIKAQMHLQQARLLLNAMDAAVDEKTFLLIAHYSYQSIAEGLKLDALCDIESTCEAITDNLLDLGEEEDLVAYVLFEKMDSLVAQEPAQRAKIAEYITHCYVDAGLEDRASATVHTFFLKLAQRIINELPENSKQKFASTEQSLVKNLKLYSQNFPGIDTKKLQVMAETLYNQHLAKNNYDSSNPLAGWDILQVGTKEKKSQENPAMTGTSSLKTKTSRPEVQSKPVPPQNTHKTSKPARPTNTAQNQSRPHPAQAPTTGSTPRTADMHSDSSALPSTPQVATTAERPGTSAAENATNFQEVAKRQAEEFRKKILEQSSRPTPQATPRSSTNTMGDNVEISLERSTYPSSGAAYQTPAYARSANSEHIKHNTTVDDANAQPQESNATKRPAGYVPIKTS